MCHLSGILCHLCAQIGDVVATLITAHTFNAHFCTWLHAFQVSKKIKFQEAL